MKHYLKPGDQIKDYSIVKLIGEGRYGIAYLAQKRPMEHYLIKQLKESMIEKTRASLFYEKELLGHLDSPHFPKFIDTFKVRNMEGYILEYIDGIVFEDMLRRGSTEFRKQEIYSVALQLVEIIMILQQNNIIHRDIRPPNVIRKKDGSLALIDFGLARYIENKDEQHSRQIDYWYLGDFLIHLLYMSYYQETQTEEQPWFKELYLTDTERIFLQKLMGIQPPYLEIQEIQYDLLSLFNNS